MISLPVKILLIKTSSMGDIVHTLPAVTEAHDKIPNLNIDWVVESGFAEIPKWHEAIKNVIPISFRKWRKHPIDAIRSKEPQNFLRTLRAEYYDYIIDAQGLLKSAVIAKIARGKKCGYSFGSAREPLASVFYRHRYNIAKDLHAIDRIRLLFAEILNYTPQKNVIDYGLEASPYLVPKLAISSTEKYLVFVHGTTSDAKCWEEAKWISLAKLAAQYNVVVKLPWGTEEELQRALRIQASSTNVVVLPKMTLTEIAGVLYGAEAIVAVDTGLGHLAAALNKPTISLYGVTKPKLIGTVGKKVHHIVNLHDVEAETVFLHLIPILAEM